MGTLPVWLHSRFSLIFISRACLGFGIGLFNRLLIQWIGDMFRQEPGKQARALGLESAFEGFGGILMTLLIGQLARYTWTISFSAYGIAMVGIILLFLLSDAEETKGKSYPHPSDEVEIGLYEKKSMVCFGLLLFLIVVMFINFNLSITPLLIEKGIGNATTGSNMIAAIAFGAFVAGNLFGKNYQLFGDIIFPLALLVGGIAVCLTTLVHSSIIILVLSGILGFAFRTIMPYFFHIFSQKGAVAARYGATVILISYNLGVTVAPYVGKAIETISKNTSAYVQMITISSTFVIVGLSRIFFIKTIKK